MCPFLLPSPGPSVASIARSPLAKRQSRLPQTCFKASPAHLCSRSKAPESLSSPEFWGEATLEANSRLELLLLSWTKAPRKRDLACEPDAHRLPSTGELHLWRLNVPVFHECRQVFTRPFSFALTHGSEKPLFHHQPLPLCLYLSLWLQPSRFPGGVELLVGKVGTSMDSPGNIAPHQPLFSGLG